MRILKLISLALATQAAALAASVVLTGPTGSAIYGHPVTLIATAAPSGATGKVTFYDGTTVLGTRMLSDGSATFNTSLLPSGARSLKAYYGGDASHRAAASAVLPLTVAALPQEGFRAAMSYNAGGNPTGVAVGDFNGDGTADLAVANEASSTVSVLLGNGDGSFQAPLNSNVGSEPFSLAVGDFNGDGKADLAVAKGSTNNISVLLGNGDGTFQAAVSYAAGSEPRFVAVSDLNEDGKPDLVVADYNGNRVSVLLGNGDGTFQVATSHSVGPNPQWVAFGDFNGDGNADLAVANGSANTTGVGNIGVLLGNGDGTFGAAVTYVADVYPASVAVGDFNGDGKEDLVVVNDGSQDVSVLLGNGDGTFQAAVNYTVPGAAGITSGDFNGDGITDLAVGNGQYRFVSVLLGNGDGTFQAPVTWNSAGLPYSLAAGDFNGDGLTDLAGADSRTASVSVLLGNQPPPPRDLPNSDRPYDAATAAAAAPRMLAPQAVWGLSTGGQITTIAGNGASYGGTGDGTPATTASMGPFGVTVDAIGNFYIADTTDNQIRRVDRFTGIITTVAGNGVGAMAGDFGPATSAGLNMPYGIALDSAGDLFIADSGDGRIRKVAVNTGIITTVAGGGLTTNGGDGGPAVAAGLSGPEGVAVAGNGDLYIADTRNNLIRKVTASTGIITTYAGVFSQSGSYSGDGGPATSAHLNMPTGVALDAVGNLYIADSYNGLIRKVDAASGIISTFAGGGNVSVANLGDGGQATLAWVGGIGIAFDSIGNLYISDSGNSRIRKVSVGGIINTVAGDGIYGFTGDGGPALAAELRSPTGVAVDSQGNLYFSDNARIRFVLAGTPTQLPQTIAFGLLANQVFPVAPFALTASSGSGLAVAFSSNTTGVCTVSGNTVTVIAGGLCSIVAIQSGNSVYLSAAPVIQTFTVALTGPSWGLTTGLTTNAQITTLAGNGAASYSGDGSVAAAATLNQPVAVALDAGGNVFIADLGNERIRRIDAASGVITTVAGTGTGGSSVDGGLAVSSQLANPTGIALDAQGDFYFAEPPNNKIRKVAAATGIITTAAGNGVAGFAGDGGQATGAALNNPGGVAVDSVGNLYIADTKNNRIREVAVGSGVISTAAGSGTAGWSGDGGAAASAQLNSPFGVAIDSAGNLYIADSGNARIRKVAASTGVITTIAGSANVGFAGDGGPALTAWLGSPTGVAFDNAGNVYFADSSNGRIRVLYAATGIINTIAGNGSPTPNPLGDGGPAVAAQLTMPTSVALDGAGNLFIADYGGDRVRFVLGASQIKSQTLTLLPVADQSITAPPFQVTATASSGLPVSFASSTPSVCSVTGNTVSLSTTGTCSLSSNQAGSAVYAAAGPVIRSFNVIGMPQAITFPLIPDQISPSTISLFATASSGLPVTYGFTPPVAGPCQLDSNGQLLIAGGGQFCTVTAYQAGNSVYAAATPVTQTFTVVDNWATTEIGEISTLAGNGTNGNSGDGGLAAAAALNQPAAIAVDGLGNVYIADTNNNRVRKVSAATQVIAAFAGSGAAGFSGDGGAATSANLSAPKGIAQDNAGNVYVADTGNNRIRKIAVSGVITTLAGTGVGGYTGDGGAAMSAQLSAPIGIAVDSSGNIYVGDSGNAAVRRINASDGKIETLASLDASGGIAVDSAGNVYAGGLAQIKKIAAGTNLVSVVAGTGAQGFSGDGGLATAASFHGPLGISADAGGNLAVADSGNQRLRGIGAGTGIVTTISGTGAAGYNGEGSALTAMLNQPAGVAVDVAGDLYVADTLNNRVRFVRQPSPGLRGQSIAFSPIADQLYGAVLTLGATADSGLPVIYSTVNSGNVCAVSGNSLTMVGAGQCTVLAAQPGNSVYAPAFPATQTFDVGGGPQVINFPQIAGQYLGAQITLSLTSSSGLPVSISTMTPSVCDSGRNPNGTYTIYTLAPGICTVWVTQNGTSDWAPAYLTQNFNVSVTLSSGPAWGLTANGQISTIAGIGISGPTVDGQPAMLAVIPPPVRVAVDNSGNVYMSDTVTGFVRRVSAAAGTIKTVAGDHENPNNGYGDGGPAVNAYLASPRGLASDTAGNLYIADSQFLCSPGQIRKVNAASGIISTVAGGGVGGDGGLATLATISPSGVALDGAGNIYIADCGNNRIRKVTAATGIITTVAGNGTAGYSGDGAAAVNARLNGPLDVSSDFAGNLYVADTGNNAVRWISTDGTITTIAGTGVPGYSGDGIIASSALLYNPNSVAVDRFGNIYLADTGNNRVRVINNATGIISTVAGTGSAGYAGDPGSLAVSAMLNAPQGVAVDAAGNVYIADTANERVRFVLMSGSTVTGTKQSEAGIFRQNYVWALDSANARNGNAALVYANFVTPVAGDIPVAGDWSGSGKSKIGIYRQTTGTWFLDYNGDGVYEPGIDKTYQFGGLAGDVPVAGDWTGSGYAHIGIVRPFATGGTPALWILDITGNGIMDSNTQVFGFGGVTGDVPVVGDWTGNGIARVGMVRPFAPGAAPALWILDANNDHVIDTGDLIFAFGGITGDVPVAGDWNGSGTGKAGLVRQGFLWVLDNNGSAPTVLGGAQNVVFPFGGVPGDMPIVGKW